MLRAVFEAEVRRYRVLKSDTEPQRAFTGYEQAAVDRLYLTPQHCFLTKCFMQQRSADQ